MSRIIPGEPFLHEVGSCDLCGQRDTPVAETAARWPGVWGQDDPPPTVRVCSPCAQTILTAFFDHFHSDKAKKESAA